MQKWIGLGVILGLVGTAVLALGFVLASIKTTEDKSQNLSTAQKQAKHLLKRLSVSVKGYYFQHRSLPTEETQWTPTGEPGIQGYPVRKQDWEATTWKLLSFRPTAAHHYQLRYVPNQTGASLEARGQGDSLTVKLVLENGKLVEVNEENAQP